jgi:HTH-type transcriptional regulator, sugar sensing transcriptional regulator
MNFEVNIKWENNMITAEQLIDLGLTKEESKVYLAVLVLGGSFVSAIARRAEVNRATCYHTLGNLVSKGLVSSYSRGKLKHFSAENPKKFVQMATDRLDRAKELMPELMSITNALAFKPKVRFLEGKEGIKTVFDDILESGEKEVLGYTNVGSLVSLFPDAFKKYCYSKVKRKIKTRYIIPAAGEGVDVIDDYFPKNYDQRLLEILAVNPDQFFFENEIVVYGNKVAVISLNKDELIGLLVESATFAKSMRSIFDLAWLGATAFVAR